jgi:hypothetical protein
MGPADLLTGSRRGLSKLGDEQPACWCGVPVTAHADDMALIPRAELDALRAENRRLRREAGNREALQRIRSDSGEGRTFTREELAEAWGISE